MSGMDQFLAQHYGNTPTDEDVEKIAQAEMFLKLASEHGVDLNSLTDAQVNELWQATWDQEKVAEDEKKEEHEEKETPKEESLEEKAKKEHEEKKASAEQEKEASAKFEEGDAMGKIMAHSYVAELRKIAEAGALDFLKEAGTADKLRAAGRRVKDVFTGKAVEQAEHKAGVLKGLHAPKGTPHYRYAQEAKDAVKHEKRLRAGAIGGSATVGAGAVGGGAYAATRKGEKEKSSSANLDFIAANVALQKLAEDNWDLEEGRELLQGLLNEGPSDSEKVAHVQDFESAVDVRSSELLEEIGYPINWEGTIFEKDAGAMDRLRSAGKRVKDVFSGKAVENAEHQAGVWKGLHAPKGTPHHRYAQEAKDTVKHEKRLRAGAIGGSAAVGAGAVGGGAYAATRKKSDGEKKAEAEFDLAAGELALQKAAEAGWNAEEATDRLNAVLTLGPGDPSESEKVAQAKSEEQALDFRACELLELAGYTINW